MQFGIYAGSAAGTDTGLAIGKPDNATRILQALNDLEVGSGKLLVRGYIHYEGDGRLTNEAPEMLQHYAINGRKLDLVLCYRASVYDRMDWTQAVRNVIDRYAAALRCLQITEEPNLKTVYAGDGQFENIEQALFDGVLAAKEHCLELVLDVQIGFNAVPSFGADAFWPLIGSAAFAPFRGAVDYVGIDFFPGVFRPVGADGAPDDLERSVKGLLHYFRTSNLAAGGISTATPIHITEQGFPTTADRTYQKQAAMLETAVRATYSVSQELNITHYEVFGLRDADSNNPNLFYQLGLLKGDYTPKPAYHTFQKLVAELGT